VKTETINIDPNMYKLFTDDSNSHCAILLDIFKSGDVHTFDAIQLDKAINACDAIVSAAKLCNVSFISEPAQAIEKILQLAKNEQKNLNDDDYIIISNTLTIIADLNNTSHDNIEAWLNSNQATLDSNSQYLQKCCNSNNPEKNTGQSESIKNEPAEFDLMFDESMLELFAIEADTQTKLINSNLLELELDPHSDKLLEPLMRASHSLKGAARMIGLDPVVDIAHGMEDCFVKCQKGSLSLNKYAIDIMLGCNDILEIIATTPPKALSSWFTSNSKTISDATDLLLKISNGDVITEDMLPTTPPETDQLRCENTDNDTPIQTDSNDVGSNAIRVQSNRMTRIMGISNEILVSHNWIQSHIDTLQIIKKRQTEFANAMDTLKLELEEIEIPDKQYATLLEAMQKAEFCRQALSNQISQTDEYDRRSYVLSSKLNQEIIASRMRPFSEGAHGFQRMTRDISHALEKNINLQLEGLDTLIDSDILDKIEAPLTHLIRNAIDHGIETPEERRNKSKPEAGTIRIHAYHHSGVLIISISDDGKGINQEKLKNKIITQGHVNQKMADRLSESELLDFLFLPGFSTRSDVTEFSGRGVGLDVVHSVVTELRGKIRCSSDTDKGLSIELQLPLTLSVLRTLLTEIAGEYYAFPLARIHTVLQIEPSDIFSLENKQFIHFNNHEVSLIDAGQILDNKTQQQDRELLDVIILSNHNEQYALVVDKVVDRQELALHKIDHRLGKIKDISAAAIADNGLPVLVLDIDDIFISIQELIKNKKLGGLSATGKDKVTTINKQILVIDDSLTVREVEKKLLESRGYSVDIAVDGADGWNTVRNKHYDLVITDIDMPRMNGIELVNLIKQDNMLKSIPIMIVSYKDNPDDRRKGLEAGADYYLTKGSFHDESLIDAVIDLIGEALE